MSLTPGARLGSYEIIASIGAGGMSEVYRAWDPKLKREVAIKVLPDHLAESPELLARFEREAQAVASLSHPNILAIYDLGREADVSFAVMELLEGETLRSRLSRSSLPTSKAIDFALQIARGLAAAHDKEIVHRDLKPENVFVTSNGRIKILDFGLAQLKHRHLPKEGEADAPTAARYTTPGSVLGTVGYMSPEQVRGGETDPRSDIFSFGAMLYEMLSGHRAFKSDSAVETMSAILKEEPPELSAMKEDLSPALSRIVQHCLEKRPEERFRDSHDLAFALESVSSTSWQGREAVPDKMRWRLPPALLLLALGVPLALGLGWWLGVRSLASKTASAPVSFTQITDQPGVESSPNLAPDGRTFVFVSQTRGNSDILLQRVGGRIPINLTESSVEDDNQPAFSPDGDQIAFRSEREGGGIFLMGSTGESVKRLTDFGYDPAWSPEGSEIAVSTEAVGDPAVRISTAEIWAINVSNGEKRRITRQDAVQPNWSPNRRRIAFWGLRPGGGGQRDIFTAPADGGEAVPVTSGVAVDWNPVWSPDGNYLYFSSNRGGAMNLWRIPIDEESGKVTGDAEPETTPARWSGSISFSHDGRRLLYATLDRRSGLKRFGFDPVRGSVIDTPIPIIEGSRTIRDQSISPDGEWVAFTSWGDREDVFVVRSDGTDFRRLTEDAFRDRGVSWSPDGEWITFYSDRNGRYQIWAIHPDGSGLEQLSQTSGSWYPLWSPDGTRIAATDGERAWILDMTRSLDEREGEPLPPMNDSLAFWPLSWSPDGKSLAGMGFRPDASVPQQIFIYSFRSGVYEKVIDSGAWPVWLRDGTRMLFVQDGREIRVFDTRSGQTHLVLAGGELFTPGGRRFSVSKDNRWLSFTETKTEGDVWLLSFE